MTITSYQSIPIIINEVAAADYVLNGLVPININLNCSHPVNRINIKTDYAFMSDQAVGIYMSQNSLLPVSLATFTSMPLLHTNTFLYFNGSSTVSYKFNSDRDIRGSFEFFLKATDITALIANPESTMQMTFEYVLE